MSSKSRFQKGFVLFVRLGLLCVCAAFLVATTRGNDSGSAEIVKPVEMVVESLKRFRDLSLRASAVAIHSSIEGTPSEERKFIIKSLGSRAYLSVMTHYKNVSKPDQYYQKDYVVFSSGEVLGLDVVLHDPAKLDSKAKYDSMSLVATYHSKRLAGSQAVSVDTVFDALEESAAEVWVLPGNPLVKLLQVDSVRCEDLLGSGKTDDPEGVSIVTTSEDGEFRLRASESNSWLPDYFELIKSGEHKVFGERLSSAEGDQKRIQMSWTGEVLAWGTSQQGDRFPKSMRVVFKDEFANGRIDVKSTAVEVEDCTLSPTLGDADFISEIPIALGQRITLRGAEHLPFEWDGRSVVPGVQERPLGAKGDLASRSKSSPRLMLIVVNVACATGLIVWFVRRMRTNAK